MSMIRPKSKFREIVVPVGLFTVTSILAVGLAVFFASKAGGEEIDSLPCQQPSAIACKPK